MTGKRPGWQDREGAPIACRDKLEILNENFEELRHVMQDAFDDAILMGVDEAQVRAAFGDLAVSLKTPKRP